MIGVSSWGLKVVKVLPETASTNLPSMSNCSRQTNQRSGGFRVVVENGVCRLREKRGACERVCVCVCGGVGCNNSADGTQIYASRKSGYDCYFVVIYAPTSARAVVTHCHRDVKG